MSAPDGPSVILHVEDDPINRALLRAIATHATSDRIRESTLLEASDLAAAREILTIASVDVVLLDVRLPDGSGLDLAREIRDGTAGARPIVIVMSASVLASEQDAALRAGADRFLPKPYAPAELTSLLDGYLR